MDVRKSLAVFYTLSSLIILFFLPFLLNSKRVKPFNPSFWIRPWSISELFELPTFLNKEKLLGIRFRLLFLFWLWTSESAIGLDVSKELVKEALLYLRNYLIIAILISAEKYQSAEDRTWGTSRDAWLADFIFPWNVNSTSYIFFVTSDCEILIWLFSWFGEMKYWYPWSIGYFFPIVNRANRLPSQYDPGGTRL